MLRIDRKDAKLTTLATPKLQEAGIAERYDLQRMIRSSPEAFFAEVREPLLLIGEEIMPSDLVGDRIDLLAVDKSGEIVIIELKRASEKLHLLQAISYASMIAEWQPLDFIKQYAGFAGLSIEDATQKIEEFLDEGDADLLNKSQRIVLCAEDFDYVLLTSARWLSEKYGLSIRCYALSLACDGQSEYLSCSRTFPSPKLEDTARRVRRQLSSGRVSPELGWDEIIAQIENPDLATFFREQIEQGRQSYPNRRSLLFSLQNVRLFTVTATRQYGYAIQKKRFADDLAFWQSRLNDKESVETIGEGRELRFYLKTKDDINAFRAALEEFDRSLPEFQSAPFIESDLA